MRNFSFFILVLWAVSASSEIYYIPKPLNAHTASMEGTVTKNEVDNTYTYSYSVSNSQSSEQVIDVVLIPVSEDLVITEKSSPENWEASRYNEYIMWTTYESGNDNYWAGHPLEDYLMNPPAFAIKPGQTLSGFSITTYSSPEEALAITSGFVQLPLVDEDTTEEELEAAGYVMEGFEAGNPHTVMTPTGPVFDGNRRPAVDGFISYPNLDGRTTDFYGEALEIYFKLSLNGETVDRSTLKVYFNDVDIRSKLIPDTSGVGDYFVRFEMGDAPLLEGKNLLVVSIDGVMPGTERNATDTDRLIINYYPIAEQNVLESQFVSDFTKPGKGGNQGKSKNN